MLDRLPAVLSGFFRAGVASRTRLTTAAVATLALMTSLGVPAVAQSRGPEAMEYVQQVNTRFGSRGGIESADAVLFPAIMAMDPVPTGVTDLEAASLLIPGMRNWDRVAAWAAAAPQQAVIEAVKTITTTSDKRYRFVLPYDKAGLPKEQVDAGLVIDLAPLNLLASAKFKYLHRLDEVASLLSIEATRLAAEGRFDDAFDVLHSWLLLGRIVVDRGMSLEKYWGFGTMLVAMERMRDIAYLHQDRVTIDQIARQLNRMKPVDLRFDLIDLPEGDRIAAKQLVARTMTPRGSVNAPAFAATMGLLEADGREMVVYDKAAFYRTVASVHAGYDTTNDKIDALFGGWQSRWNIRNPHDELLTLPSDFMQMDRRQYYALMVVLSDIEWLYPLRLVLLQELHGTQTSLGLVGYRARHREWPKRISAISPNPLPRPGGMTPLWVDNFNWNKRFERLEDMRYFVPMRDTPTPPNGQPEPHQLTVIGGSLFEMFSHNRPADIGLAAAQVGSVTRVGVIDFDASNAASSSALGDSSIDSGGLDGLGAPGLSIGQLMPQFAGAGVPFPDDLIDLDKLTINAASLRRYLLEIAKRSPATQETRDNFIDLLKQLEGGMGINPQNLAQELPAAIQMLLTQNPLVVATLKSEGIDAHRLSKALEGAARAFASGPELNRAIQEVSSTGTVSTELLDRVFAEAINNVCQQEHVDQLSKVYFDLMLKAAGDEDRLRENLREFISATQLMAESGVDQVTGTSLQRYTAKITDKHFILYSVGADAANGQARRVGLRGNDILYWPPLLSLKREHLHGPAR